MGMGFVSDDPSAAYRSNAINKTHDLLRDYRSVILELEEQRRRSIVGTSSMDIAIPLAGCKY